MQLPRSAAFSLAALRKLWSTQFALRGEISPAIRAQRVLPCTTWTNTWTVSLSSCYALHTCLLHTARNPHVQTISCTPTICTLFAARSRRNIVRYSSPSSLLTPCIPTVCSLHFPRCQLVDLFRLRSRMRTL
jgi:hypothetical protein